MITVSGPVTSGTESSRGKRGRLTYLWVLGTTEGPAGPAGGVLPSQELLPRRESPGGVGFHGTQSFPPAPPPRTLRSRSDMKGLSTYSVASSLAWGLEVTSHRTEAILGRGSGGRSLGRVSGA